jgi:hypothetical protein
MQKFIEYIINLFSQFKPHHQIGLVLLVGGLIFLGYNFVKNPAFRKSVLNFIVKGFKSFFNKTELSTHELFFRGAIYNRQILTVQFRSEIKTKLFQILLHEKTKSIIQISKKWLSELNYNLSNELLIESMYTNLDSIIKDFEANLKKRYIEEIGEDKGKKALCFIYHKKADGFKDIDADNLRFITSSILKIGNSKAFTQKQKIYHYFTLLELAIENAITDCEILFDKLNGDVDRLMNIE